MQRFPDQDPYEILGLDHRCSPADIKAAYKKHALKSHPDRAPPELKEAATARFKVIAEAYETLSDDRKRRDYDMFSPRGRGSFTRGAGPSSAYDDAAAADDLDSAARQHFGTSPDGQAFSFTWESSADSARRAQRGRRFGRPFGADGFDPFELFNMMFENEFGSMPGGRGSNGLGGEGGGAPGRSGFMGMGGASSPFGAFMDHDPFMQNHRSMADFGGFGFGIPPSRAPNMGNGGFAQSPFGPPGHMAGGFGGSMLSSMLSGGGGGGGGMGGFQGMSESTSTRIVNGRQETISRKVDMQGNETVHRVTPEGQTVHINGVEQRDHPLLGTIGSGSGASNHQPARAPLPGSREMPIEVDGTDASQPQEIPQPRAHPSPFQYHSQSQQQGGYGVF